MELFVIIVIRATFPGRTHCDVLLFSIVEIPAVRESLCNQLPTLWRCRTIKHLLKVLSNDCLAGLVDNRRDSVGCHSETVRQCSTVVPMLGTHSPGSRGTLQNVCCFMIRWLILPIISFNRSLSSRRKLLNELLSSVISYCNRCSY